MCDNTVNAVWQSVNNVVSILTTVSWSNPTVVPGIVIFSAASWIVNRIACNFSSQDLATQMASIARKEIQKFHFEKLQDNIEALEVQMRIPSPDAAELQSFASNAFLLESNALGIGFEAVLSQVALATIKIGLYEAKFAFDISDEDRNNTFAQIESGVEYSLRKLREQEAALDLHLGGAKISREEISTGSDEIYAVRGVVKYPDGSKNYTSYRYCWDCTTLQRNAEREIAERQAEILRSEINREARNKVFGEEYVQFKIDMRELLQTLSSLATATPSRMPSIEPSPVPSGKPSIEPTISQVPSSSPSNWPSLSPVPSTIPSDSPSSLPSDVTSAMPSVSSLSGAPSSKLPVIAVACALGSTVVAIVISVMIRRRNKRLSTTISAEGIETA